MTRTELLSLAERLEIPNDPMRFARDGVNAAAPLRKLAELRPVAWIVHSKTGMIRATWSAQPSADQLECAALDGDIVTPLYTLSEILTDD